MLLYLPTLNARSFLLPNKTQELPSLKQLRQWSKDLGFSSLGISDIDLGSEHSQFNQWLKKGYAGDMNYLHRNRNKRLNPALLVPETNRIISVTMNYLSPKTEPKKALQDNKKAYTLSLIQKAKVKNVNLCLPLDNVIADDFSNNAKRQIVKSGEIPYDWEGLDIGPQSIYAFENIIKKSKTIEKTVANKTTITKINPTIIAYKYCFIKFLENSIW